MTGGGVARQKNDYGLPMACAKCGYRWLKLPGLKMRQCPNDGSELYSTRPRKSRRHSHAKESQPAS